MIVLLSLSVEMGGGRPCLQGLGFGLCEGNVHQRSQGYFVFWMASLISVLCVSVELSMEFALVWLESGPDQEQTILPT